MNNNDLMITKKVLQQYHENKVKKLALEEKYKELAIYEVDANGNIVYEADGVTPKLKNATIAEAINDKLSKYDILKFDEGDFKF